MTAIRKTWRLAARDDAAADRLARQCQINPVLAQLLATRGVTDPASVKLFLDAPMSHLHPPEKLPGIPDAAERIAKAVKDREPICVFGDYDVDGTTGTAILVELLNKLNADVRFEIPLRLEEGYGLNSASIRKLFDDGVRLLITVDCGISALDEAEVAREIGMDLIVTDHHEMKPQLPAGLLVHPRLAGSEYPFGGLSGAGVAFKLAWAVAQKASGSERVSPVLREYLLDAMGLAALGLIADVMPLRDENRIFTRHGLKRLVDKPSRGIRALLEEAKLLGKVRAEDVSFKLGPRINSAGRLGCARLVVELLTTTNDTRAKEIAMFLEGTNAQRQTLERRMTTEAKEMVTANGYADRPAIVVGAVDWHQGVVGIVASRLADHFGRPALVASLKETDLPSTGSGRSVAGFELHKALEYCNAELLGHGGHAAAAGFRVLPSKMDALRDRFCEHVAAVFPNGAPTPTMLIDAEVSIASLNFNLLRDLDKLEPYGQDNPRPKFLASGLTVEAGAKKMGVGERHLQFRVRQGNTVLRAVGWGLGDRLDELMSDGGNVCVAFTPRINEWQDRRTIEIEVIDFQAKARAELG